MNQDTLVTLYHELETRLGEEAARFIVALRMHGPMNDEEVPKFNSEAGIKERQRSAEARLAQQLSGAESLRPKEQAVIRGFNIQNAPIFPVRSVVDLIDRKVEVMMENKEVILSSPWKANAAQLESSIVLLESVLSITSGERNLSRINLLGAEMEVLMTVPEINRELAGLIMQRRSAFSAGSTRLLTVDLYSTGAIKLQQLRSITPFVTQGGDVYRGFVVSEMAGSRQRGAMSFLVDGCPAHAEILELAKVAPPYSLPTIGLP